MSLSDNPGLRLDADGYAIVPHVERDLAPLGLARLVPVARGGKAYKILPEGQRRISAAMAYNHTMPPRAPDYRRDQ